MSYKLWFLIGQDVERPVGGVKQIFRLAECLSSLNFSVVVVQGTSGYQPPWFHFNSNVSLTSLNLFKSHKFDQSKDVIVLPETFIPQYFALPKVKKIIFNQNYGYTFGENLDIKFSFVRKVYSDPMLLKVLCVSSADYKFLIESLLVSPSKVSQLINPIETELFKPSFPKQPLIIYMPRKNSAHSNIVTKLIANQHWFASSGWKLVPLHKLSQLEVAEFMRQSFLYLSFGCPEGFGLPIAESLACGCNVVGYTGVGGMELFNIGSIYQAALPVDFFDFYSFVDFVGIIASRYNRYRSVSGYDLNLHCSDHIRSQYSFAAFSDSVSKSFVNVFS